MISELYQVESKKTIEIPKVIKAQINAAFSGLKTSEGFFVIEGEKANNWLADQIGIFSSGNPVTQINNEYVVWWDWNIQKFKVRA